MNESPDNQEPEAPRRMGGAMIAAAWLVVIAVVGMLFADLLEGQFNPNREVRSRVLDGGHAQVELHRNRQGHYVASGRINGEPVVFLVDTGATDVSVPAHLASRLGLERGRPIQAQTANGVVTAWRTTLDRVELGDIAMGGVRANINPGMQGNEVLLGMSFLGELELTQRDGLLTLTHRDPA